MRKASLRRWLTPSLLDCVLLSLLLWQFAVGGRWATLLADGDTGWHIRTGEYVLQERRWPEGDLFSFSKPGQTWYAWEWLADVALALAHQAGGLSAVTILAALVIVAAGGVTFRRMLAAGSNVWVAMITLMLAMGAASIHFLARPHVFTLLAWTVSLGLVEADRRRPGKAVWWLAPLCLLWTNLHGGFVALLVSLAALAAGRSVEALVDRRASDARRAALRYAGLLAACAAASLVNPYGGRLHAHIFRYLGSDWIRNVVDEFQSPKFRSEHSLHFELLLFAALMLTPALVGRRQFGEASLVLMWAHAALVSARHVPLFALLAAPWVAAELSRLWGQAAARLSARSPLAILNQVGEDLRPAFLRSSGWAAVGLAAVLAATPSSHWPQDFPEQKFPTRLVARHAERLAGARVFTSDQWADYLIYRFYPRQRVYLDGRSDFYGPEIGDAYLKAVQARPGWGRILARWEFRYVLAPREWPLAGVLEQASGWRKLDGDRVAVLYERVEAGAH